MKILSQLTNGGMTVTIDDETGLRVTADTDLKAGATWETGEINHLSLQSGVGRFLNRRFTERAEEEGPLEVGYTEIAPECDVDLRISVGPNGVHLLLTEKDGTLIEGKLKEMGVDSLVEHLTAYKAARDARLKG